MRLLFFRKRKEYKQAEKLFKQGEYMEAVDLYFDLYAVFDYKDCEEKYKMCYYEYGKQLVAEEDWQAAIVQFSNISNYEDTEEYRSACEAHLAYGQLLFELESYELSMSDLQMVSYECVSLGDSKYGELFTTGAHFTSEEFDTFTDNDKLTVFEAISDGYLLASACTITSGGSVYSFVNIDRENVLIKDGEKFLTRLCIDSPTYKTFTSGSSCPVCNGSGSVRYNYGSSDLEAILSGNDPFTVGKCTSCGGKGTFSTTVKRTDVPKADAQKIKDGTYEAEKQAAQAEKEAQALKELLQEKIDTFGSATGDQDAGSVPYFAENRESYELLDAVAIMQSLIGEWTMKTDSANIAAVTFHDDYTGIYTDADGNEFPMSWVFDEIFASEITPYPMTAYEVRKAGENLLVFYSDRDNLPHFILYKA